ncbi:LysR family transcriptional regulator [Nocardioides aquaticus]|uniref:LysR family transcriptional regulator n=1 Tax=Nocardioides aquaticus TaxID=160826 RepID=UPI0031D4830E
MGIDVGIRHLRAVVAVADESGYSAAAARLHTAQSSLSRTVQDVERRIGVRLFERTTRSVVPTREGAEFCLLARGVLAEHDRALAHFEGFLRGERGTVSVAVLPSLAATLLPPVLAAYRAARPDVAVEVRDGLAAEVTALVLSGAVDLALTVADDLPAALQAVTIAEDDYFLLVPARHALATRPAVTWADLGGEPFVAFDHASSIRTFTDRVLVREQVPLGPVTEARNVGSVAGLVGAGLGVSVVPALVLPMTGFADVVAVPLRDPVGRRAVRLLRDPRRPVAPAVAGLVTMLADAATHGIRLPAGARWTEPGPPGPRLSPSSAGAPG